MKPYVFDPQLKDRALKEFGIKNQLRQLQEEMSELSIEIHHFFRGRNENCVDELADVLIVLNQLEDHFGSEFIQRSIEKKEKRFKSFLDYRDRVKREKG